jgi:hypothetical protein
MIHYIKDNKNNTLIDLECWNKTENNKTFTEISVGVDIKNYSLFLINMDKNKRNVFIHTIDALSGLRSWLWENFYRKAVNNGEDIDEIQKEIADAFECLANDFNLKYTTD